MPSYDQYQQYIQNDPIYQQALANLAAGDVSAQAQAQAAARRAAILFGDPNAIPAGWIDADTSRLAGQNRYSTLAQLGRSHETNLRQMQDALAARGALRSGELPHGLEQENLAYGQAQYTARQELLDYLAGVQAGLAGSQQTSASARAQALSDAYQRAVEQYAGTVADQEKAAAPPAAPPPPPRAPARRAPARPVNRDPWQWNLPPVRRPAVPRDPWQRRFR
jgi:hypothetical protein